MATDNPEVEVVVVPVAVRQHGWQERPTLMGWPGEDGTWLRARPRDRADGSADGTAQQLLENAHPPGAEHLLEDREDFRADRVTFLEETVAGRVRLTLLYTFAFPMALADPGLPEHDRWIPLVKPEPKATEARQVGARMVGEAPNAFEIADYWRRVLEATAGGLRFLAHYWAMPQLRDVYSAVWGYEQDPAAFSKWAVGRRGALTRAAEPIEDADLTQELAKALEDASTSTSPDDDRKEAVHDLRQAATRTATMAAWEALTRTLRSPQGVGLRLGKGSPLHPAVIAGVAALVAYQASTRGPAPTWYETKVSEPQEHKLERPYTPRPAWLVPAG